MKTVYPRASPLLVLILATALVGCDEETKPEDTNLQQELAQSWLKAEQERHELEQLREQDRRVLDAGRKEAEADASTAILAWAATALALAVVIFLAARERHLRSVVEHVLRVVLGRQRKGEP